MAKNLVIVESPAKAKTIGKFLGKDFEIEACYGHVRDLAHGGLGVDVDKKFEPNYENLKDKAKVLKELRSKMKNKDLIYIATDPDREGEAIAWHLEEALKLPKNKTKRIVFNEITESAVKNAVDSPRNIDHNLVNAQQARRVLDRLVGFELSPILWKKLKRGLSAGRVQSVALRISVEREREINQFDSVSYFKVVANFKTATGVDLQAELDETLSEYKLAKTFMDICQAATFKIESVVKKLGKRTPPAPFTTSSLQQEASRKLGFSVTKTMVVAQKLYEAGHITYMRTDSTHLSDQAINQLKKEIIKTYGNDYSEVRQYQSNVKGAQEAHEAIRPSYVNKENLGSDSGEKALYNLIRKRTLASQMAQAQIERTIAKIVISDTNRFFQANGEIIVFDGFLKVYKESEDESEKDKLPQVNEGDDLGYSDITAEEKFTKHPARYTEASLVKKLEELGIGRPSTYAPIISTIQKRGYVLRDNREGSSIDHKQIKLVDNQLTESEVQHVLGTEKAKLFPTDMGLLVTDFLVKHFEDILDYNFTANLEKDFDVIAEGKKEWTSMIGGFYKSFHKEVEEVEEVSERLSGERKLGEDPKTGDPIIVRMGRYGPIAQIGEPEEKTGKKPKYASLLKEQSIETINLEQAIKLFELPRELGDYEGKPILAGIGRFGPYVHYEKLYVSLKEDDPYTIELDKAVELIKEKIEFEKNKYIHRFEDQEPAIFVMNGRFGPYINSEKKNYKIPKDVEPKSLTLEKCLDLIKNAPKPKSRRKKS